MLKELKQRQKIDGKPLGEIVSELLPSALARPNVDDQPPVEWISAPMGTPRVDLEDKDALAAILHRG